MHNNTSKPYTSHKQRFVRSLLSIPELFNILRVGEHVPAPYCYETSLYDYISSCKSINSKSSGLLHGKDVSLVKVVHEHTKECKISNNGVQNTGRNRRRTRKQSHIYMAKDDETQSQLEPATARDLYERKGYSVVLQRIKKHSHAIAQLCQSISRRLGQSISSNIYLTPAHAQGFNLHYDDHCVFVLQLCGKKRWCVYPRICQLPSLHARRSTRFYLSRSDSDRESDDGIDRITTTCKDKKRYTVHMKGNQDTNAHIGDSNHVKKFILCAGNGLFLL